MTLNPTYNELTTCYTFDLVLGTVYILDLIRIAKDSIYIKDKLSDYTIRILV